MTRIERRLRSAEREPVVREQLRVRRRLRTIRRQQRLAVIVAAVLALLLPLLSWLTS